MSLEKAINEDIKTAMLAKDKKSLEALRAVKAAILLAKTDKGSEGAISENVEMGILQKLVKQRKDSAALFQSQGRADLAEEENFQLSVIEKYLPEQMSADEVRQHVQDIITETGATSMKDMGQVMKVITGKVQGRADNKLVSELVKRALSQL